MKTARGTISPGVCDTNGHVNVVHYTQIFDSACWTFLDHLAKDLLADELGWADVQHTIKFSEEMNARENWFVRSSVEKIGTKSLTLLHGIYVDNEASPRATSEIVTVRFDRGARQAVPLEESILEVARSFLEG